MVLYGCDRVQVDRASVTPEGGKGPDRRTGPSFGEDALTSAGAEPSPSTQGPQTHTQPQDTEMRVLRAALQRACSERDRAIAERDRMRDELAATLTTVGSCVQRALERADKPAAAQRHPLSMLPPA
jgi:hypothetical protein